MKQKILSALFLSVCLAMLAMGCASTPVTIEEKVAIIEIKGQTKDLIFDNANQWAVKTFRKADCVIEYSNKDMGTISGKYITETTDNFVREGYSKVRNMITVECKDEKLRLTMLPVEILHAKKEDGIWNYNWESITTDSQEFINFEHEFLAIKTDLEKYVSSKNSDW